MDFGAVICKPKTTLQQCPFKRIVSLFEDKIFYLPVKGKKVKIKKRWFNYLLIEYKEKFAIRQRHANDIWQNLFEFLLMESGKEFGEKELAKEVRKKKWLDQIVINCICFPCFHQQLSHQHIKGRFIKMKLHKKPDLPSDLLWVRKKELKNYAFPRFINQHFEKNGFLTYHF